MKIKPQLANNYDESKQYGVGHWYATPKLDGIRALFYGGALYSRQGKKFYGLEHIEQELAQVSKKHNLKLIDGELYIRHADFNTIQSVVMTQDNIADKKQVKIKVFALGADYIEDTGQMYRLIEELFANTLYIAPIEYMEVENNPEKIKWVMQEFVNLGFEGVMLRHPETHYKPNRNNSLLKVKPIKECDLRIVDLMEGTGKYKNMLGAIVVEGIVDGKNIKCNVGTGFDDIDRKRMWHLKDKLIGKTVEVAFQDISKAACSDIYSLRFPAYRRLRLDK